MITIKSNVHDKKPTSTTLASILTTREVYRGFEPRLGQTKLTHKLVCSESEYISPSTVKCLTAECCFNEQALLNPPWSVQSRHHHHHYMEI